MENINAAINDREEWYGRMSRIEFDLNEYSLDNTGNLSLDLPSIIKIINL
ncbi:MAG: hypothetical protein JW866_00115 [Ignavibacteriales bacterium]|nr:hypothetical protein [Ignavibacteriales bacterium]